MTQKIVAWAWPDRPSTLQGMVAQVRPHAAMIIRMTAATVISYMIIHAIYPEQTDLTGALTALLVVQASSKGTLKMGFIRIGAVLSGVFVAVLVATFVGLNWWSLGLVVALSLAVASVLRLHAQLAEAGISAMLILGSSAVDQAGEVRATLTLIGAAVGVAFGLLLPAGLPISLAISKVRQVADQLADQLTAAGESLAGRDLTRPVVDKWIAEVRAISPKVDEASGLVTEITEGRELNTRAIAAVDVGPLLRTGLDTLENCLVSVRALFILIRTEIPAGTRSSAGYDDDLRLVFAVVMQHAAEAIRGFGALVDAEANQRELEAQTSFAFSLEMLREARAILAELMMTETSSSGWMLRGSILSAVEQVLHQLDLETRSKVRAEWAESQSRRFGAHLPVLVREALPQAEKPLPVLLERGLQEVRRRDVGAELLKGPQRMLRRSRSFLVPVVQSAREEAAAWNASTVDELARRVHGLQESAAEKKPRREAKRGLKKKRGKAAKRSARAAALDPARERVEDRADARDQAAARDDTDLQPAPEADQTTAKDQTAATDQTPAKDQTPATDQTPAADQAAEPDRTTETQQTTQTAEAPTRFFSRAALFDRDPPAPTEPD